jgi:Heterokaryon incompatibility protein (HET)
MVDNSDAETLPRRRRPDPLRAQIYKALDHPDAFRILILHPGAGIDPLRGSLKISFGPRYTLYSALSYVWGDPEPTGTIAIDIYELNITKNLQQALHRLRSPTGAKKLWIDAICIDQLNTIERGHQVKNMASIYRCASQVLVWLGPGTESTRQAFQIAQQLVSDEDFRKEALGSWTGSSNEKHMKALTEAEYFGRMWTTQELGLARSATFLTNSEEMDWPTLVEAYQLVRDQFGGNDLDEPLSSYPQRITYLYASFRRPKSYSFLELLAFTRTREASDPRDKVFALLSHSSAIPDSYGCPTIIEPSYENSVGRVYRNIALAAVRQDQGLDVLSYVNHHRDQLRLQGWPSWVPRWDQQPMTTPIVESLRPEREGRNDGVALGPDDRLTIRGFFIDDIRMVDHDDYKSTDNIPLGVREGRASFVTKSGRRGLGPAEIIPGDSVYILRGGRVPFILRKFHWKTVECAYNLVGEAYVEGLLHVGTDRLRADLNLKETTIHVY